MPQLLLELFSEEIPARMQATAAEYLKKTLTDALVARGLLYEGAKAFVTPRRIALTIHGLNAFSPDVTEEKKGPRVDAPQQALEGFLKGAGFASLSEADIVKDPKKGDYYVAKTTKKGEATTAVIGALMPDIIRNFQWAKSQRWGNGTLKWVRPLHSIVCTFGVEAQEPDIIAFEIEGITASNVTYGHRFHAPQAITVRRFDDYVSSLDKAKVTLDADLRVQKILNDARTLCFAQGLELVEDEVLAREVAGLVEYPIVLMGSFEEEFLTIPDEVIRATIRANQKCFVVKNPKTGKLTNKFIITSNIEATDGGTAIIAGNGKVIRARLSDAKFFYETDKAKTLASRLDKFKTITYHKDIGTQYERIERIVALASRLAPQDPHVKQAAMLAKADLVTEMVGEFPELQGLMGRYYAQIEGLPTQVSNALEEHYKPAGASDSVPQQPTAIAVALADKIDQLTGFWAINEKPTGSKDPYALRRAALGVIRIILENNLRLHLLDYVNSDLLSFFADRLKVYLKDQGRPFELIDAVFALPEQDDLVSVVSRIDALYAFLKTDDGANLLAGYKRAANILKAEEKKDGAIVGDIDEKLLTLPQEKALANAMQAAQTAVLNALKTEDFAGVMSALAALRQPVDTFFTDVIVNDENPQVRLNRLRLLNNLRELTLNIADLSRV